ncbi:ATP-dependent DNA helicase, partial [Frankliniella fusca]
AKEKSWRGLKSGKIHLSTAALGDVDLEGLVGALLAEVGVGTLLDHLGPVTGGRAVRHAVEVDLLLDLLGGLAVSVAGGLGAQREADLAVLLDDLDAVAGAAGGGLGRGLAAGAARLLGLAGATAAVAGLVAAGLVVADDVTVQDVLGEAGGLVGLLLLLLDGTGGVDGPGGGELLSVLEDAVAGGGEVTDLLAVEGAAETADLTAVGLADDQSNAVAVVKDLQLLLGEVDLDGAGGHGVDLGEDVARLVLDLGARVGGEGDGAAVVLDVGVAGGGEEVNDVLVEDDLELLLVVGVAGIADQDNNLVGGVLLAGRAGAGVSVDLGDGLHHDVPVVAEVQGGLGGEHLGLAVHGVDGGSAGNPVVEADVVELSGHRGSVDGQVSGLQVGGEAELELDLVVVGVLGVDEVLGVVLPAEVTGGGVGLVGSVLDALRNLVEVDVDVVQVHDVSLGGDVLAGGQEVVSALHLLLAQLGNRLTTDELATGRGLLHLGVDVDLGGRGVQLLAESDLGLDLALGVSVQGLLEVHGGNVGHLGGDGHGELLLLVLRGRVGRGLAQVDQDAGLLVDLAVGEGGGGDELSLVVTVEDGGQVNNGGVAGLDAGGGAAEELLLAALAVGVGVGGVGEVLAGVGVLALGAEVLVGLVGVVGALALLGLLVLRVVVVRGGQGDGLGGGLLVVKGNSELVGLDGLLGGGEQQSRDGVVVLGLVVHGGEVSEGSLAGGVDAEGHAGGVLADGEVSLLGLAQLDGLLVDGGQVQDVVLGGVGLARDLSDLEVLVGVDGLQLDAHLSVLQVQVDVGADGQVHEHVLVETGDVTLVVKGSDETDLGLSAGGVSEVNVSGGVDGVGDLDSILGAVGHVGLGADASLTTDGDQSGGLQGVDEGQTHGGGEAHGQGVAVVQLGVVEVLARAESVSGVLQVLGHLLDGVVVEGEEALLGQDVDQEVGLNLLGLVSLDVKHVGDLLSGPAAGGRGAGVLAGLVGAGAGALLELLGQEVDQVDLGVLGAVHSGVEHVNGGAGVLSQLLVVLGLQVVGGGLDGGLDDGTDLLAGVLVGELSHALEHAGGRVGLHEQEDGGGADLGGVTSVLVDAEQDGAGDLGGDLGQLVQGDDHVEALEGGDGLLALEVGLEDGEDLGVGDVTKGAGVDLDLVAVTVLDGALQLLGEVGDVVTGDGGGLLGVQAAVDVAGVAGVGGGVVNLGATAQGGEGQDGGGVQELLLLDLGLFDQGEEGVHVLAGGGAGGLGENSEELGGLLTLDLVVLDPLLHSGKGGAGTGLGDGVTESLPGSVLGAGALALAGALGGGGVQLTGGLLDLLGVHDADQTGEDGELGESGLLGDLAGLLELLADLLSDLLDGVDGVDLAGGGDVAALVADEVGEHGVLGGLVQLGLALEPLLAGVDARAAGARAVRVAARGGARAGGRARGRAGAVVTDSLLSLLLEEESEQEEELEEELESELLELEELQSELEEELLLSVLLRRPCFCFWFSWLSLELELEEASCWFFRERRKRLAAALCMRWFSWLSLEELEELESELLELESELLELEELELEELESVPLLRFCFFCHFSWLPLSEEELLEEEEEELLEEELDSSLRSALLEAEKGSL